jgi:hypothetical protein
MAEAGGGDRSPRWFPIALLAVTAVALAVRIAFVAVVDPDVPRIGDASAYHLLADGLARGDGYIRPFDDLLLGRVRPTAEYPPLFPALLATPARLGIDTVDGQRMFTALVGAATVALVGLLGRRAGGPAAGVVAAGLAAVYPMLFLSEAILMAEALYAPLVAGVLLLAYRAHDAGTTGRYAALGAAVGLATLARAEGLLLGVVVLAGLAASTRGSHLREAGVALAVAGAVVAPWTVRNAIRFDAFVPVSNNVATLVDGANCDATYGGPQLGLWRENFSQLGDRARALPQATACFEGFDVADPAFDEAAVARRHRRDGLDYARDHVRSLPKVAAVRVLRTWGLYAPRQQVDFESLEGRPRSWQMRGTVMYWALLPLAIGGAIVLRRRRTYVWPLAATALTVTLVAAATYGQQRFRVAAEPAIVVCAAVALVEAARGARTASAR